MAISDASALRRNEWSRQRAASQFQREAIRESVDKMAADLDATRVALTDLALGHRIVLIYHELAKQHIVPSEEQEQALRADDALLPALLATGQARIYTRPPDVQAIKLLMGYVMGSSPTASEAHLRDEIEETRANHQFLAEVLSEFVPAADHPRVLAKLRRLAAGR